MSKNRIDANIRCPSCNGQLYPKVLACDACGLKVEGEFILNEFDFLAPDELHFLRVFVQCEGSIRDMEAALGVSYPTVKARLAAIKGKLALEGPGPGPGTEAKGPTADVSGPRPTADEILARLEHGEIDHAEAVRLLRTARKPRRQGEAQ
jgi:hypothetical protein